jgi:hypothetical protein
MIIEGKRKPDETGKRIYSQLCYFTVVTVMQLSFEWYYNEQSLLYGTVKADNFNERSYRFSMLIISIVAQVIVGVLQVSLLPVTPEMVNLYYVTVYQMLNNVTMKIPKLLGELTTFL